MRQKTKLRRSPLLITFIFICVIIWLIGAYIVSGNKKETPLIDDFAGHSSASIQTNTHKFSLSDYQTLTYEQLAEISSGYLLLINSDYRIPGDISSELTKVLDYVKTLNNELTMNKDALVMLQAMFDSAANAGYNEFRVTEGYRAHERQTLLYDSSPDKSLVALPGHSEHQTGFAADISYHGVNIANSKQGAWLADNSYKFGFILRYPQHKTDITGIPYEPWHFRYIGQVHAYFCFKNDFVLEEYIEHLKTYGKITISFNGIEYIVYYLSDANDTIEIPQNYIYSASSDNTGGIIATARNN